MEAITTLDTASNAADQVKFALAAGNTDLMLMAIHLQQLEIMKMYGLYLPMIIAIKWQVSLTGTIEDVDDCDSPPGVDVLSCGMVTIKVHCKDTMELHHVSFAGLLVGQVSLTKDQMRGWLLIHSQCKVRVNIGRLIYLVI